MPIDQPTYAPMLAGTSQGVPAGDGWAFEIKWDGFRAIARVHGDDVQLLSRNGKRLDGSTRDVAAALPAALTHARLRPRRRAVRVRRERRPALRAVPARRGRDRLHGLRPARARRRVADRASPGAGGASCSTELIVPGAPIVVLSQVYDDGEALLAAARERGLEGVMAKRRARATGRAAAATTGARSSCARRPCC